MSNHASNKSLKAHHQKPSAGVAMVIYSWKISSISMTGITNHSCYFLLVFPSPDEYQTLPINHAAFFFHPPHSSLFPRVVSSCVSERYSDLTHRLKLLKSTIKQYATIFSSWEHYPLKLSINLIYHHHDTMLSLQRVGIIYLSISILLIY